MEPISIRDKLHHYIDEAEDEKIQALYVILEDEIESVYFFNKNDIDLFNDQRQKRLNGESKTYSIEEARNLILGKPPKN